MRVAEWIRKAVVLAAFLLCLGDCRGQNSAPANEAPLARLPSAPGPHLEKIKALGDNQWLNLGKPAADPRWGLSQGRAWTSEMALAGDLRGAFLYGEGKHAAVTVRGGRKFYNDDLWFYNLNAHAWICIYPGTEVDSFECTLDKHGFEVDSKTGQQIPIAGNAHGYEMLTYDTHQKKLVLLSLSGMWWPMVLGERRRKWLDWESTDGKAKFIELYKNPFYYDVLSGKWERRPAKGSPARRRGYSAAVYIPSLRQFAYYGRESEINLFDYATGSWTVRKPKGPPPPSASDGQVCLDEARERLYVLNHGMKSCPWIYDIRTDVWIDPKPKALPGDTPPEKGYYFEGNEGCAHYDSANDVIVAHIPRLGDKSGLYIYDVKKNEWSRAPGARKGNHSFYDPVLNAHFFYDAGDSNTEPGDIWVYRFKNGHGAQRSPARILVK